MLKLKIDLLKKGEAVKEVAKIKVVKNRLEIYLLDERTAMVNRNANKVVKEQMKILIENIINEFKYVLDNSNFYSLSLKVYNPQEEVINEILIEDNFEKLALIIQSL